MSIYEKKNTHTYRIKNTGAPRFFLFGETFFLDSIHIWQLITLVILENEVKREKKSIKKKIYLFFNKIFN